VLRILPRTNEDVNEEWLADKSRFALDGLRRRRLDRPWVRRDGKLIEATWSEAFAAIAAGAVHIKLFPGSSTGPTFVRALRDVLPAACRVWAVGGASATNLHEWLAAGATGIGVGGALYRPGVDLDSLRVRANELIAAWHATRPSSNNK